MDKPMDIAKAISEIMEKRKEQKLSETKLPTPEQLREKIIREMILFNSRHGRFNSADN